MNICGTCVEKMKIDNFYLLKNKFYVLIIEVGVKVRVEVFFI